MGIEPMSFGSQPKVLPLNYVHHRLTNRFASNLRIKRLTNLTLGIHALSFSGPQMRPALSQDGSARHRINTSHRPHGNLLIKSETIGAGDQNRTGDIELGRIGLYRLSYTRKLEPLGEIESPTIALRMRCSTH